MKRATEQQTSCVFLSVQTRVIVIFSSIITFLLFHVASCIQICWYTLCINVC